MLAVVIGTLGVLIGAGLFMLGAADDSRTGGIAVAIGAVLVVVSLLWAARPGGSRYRADHVD